MRSIGSGQTIVLFFSAAISVSVLQVAQLQRRWLAANLPAPRG
jgi:hypothetical protein